MDNEDIELNFDDAIEKKFRNIKLESYVLAYVLRRDHSIIFSFDRDCFTIEPYRVIYDLVKKSKMEYPKDILIQTLKENSDKDKISIYKNYVERIYEQKLKNINHKNIDKLVFKLKNLNETRNLLATIGDIVSNVKDFDIEDAKRKLYKSILVGTQLDGKFKGDYIEDYGERKEYLQKIKDNPKILAGVPTGIKRFDQLSGGLMKGEFGVVIAGTGGGKSVALTNFATNAWLKGYNVLFVSIEMTKLQVQFRIDSRLTRIFHTKFRKSELDDEDEGRWDRVINKLKDKRNNFFEIICLPRGCCTMDVEKEANKIQAIRENNVDLIVIDYLNLMTANEIRKDAQKDWKYQSEVAWNIKTMSIEFNGTGIPIWTANQTTDEGMQSKKIETYHMKYARGISEVAPVIISLNQSIDDQLEDIIRLWIIKCRDFEKIKEPIILHPKFNWMLLNQETVQIERKQDE